MSTERAEHSDLYRLIASRRAVRRFLGDPVDMNVVRDILAAASRAPSGANMQPWRVHVMGGRPLADFCAALTAAYDDDREHAAENEYYPEKFFEPFLSRRRAVGYGLYGLLGIEKGDRAAMHRQHRRNLLFFDAPVGMIFTIDRRLGIGSWLDYGMFLQNIMILARSHGLDTCPQAAFIHWHETIRTVIPVSSEEMVVCGMALGYPDRSAPENSLATDRLSLNEFARFHTD
jgi:nitroreductase